jgi:hypothetical protein
MPPKGTFQPAGQFEAAMPTVMRKALRLGMTATA